MTIGVKRGGVNPRYMERLNRSTPASKKVKVVADRMIRPINPQVWAMGEKALIPPKKIEKGEQPFNRIAYKELIDPTLSRVVHSVVRPLPVEGPFKLLKIRQEPLLPRKSGPIQVLDAPNLVVDDAHNNLLDGFDETFYVALGNSLYSWSASKKIELLAQRESEITAIKKSGDSGVIAIADKSNSTSFYQDHQIVDAFRFESPSQAIASYQSLWILGGGGEPYIFLVDIRAPNHVQSRLIRGHSENVNSLLWNDLQPHVVVAAESHSVSSWDIRKPDELFMRGSFPEGGSFKGLAWHPKNPSRVFVGGGNRKQKIHVFDINRPLEDMLVSSLQAGNPISSLYISRDGSRLISTESVWKKRCHAVLWDIADDCSSLSPIHNFVGHSNDILGAYVYPGEKRMVTLSADETVRIWTIPQERKKESEKKSLFSPPLIGSIPSLIGEGSWVSRDRVAPQAAPNFFSLAPILNAPVRNDEIPQDEGVAAGE